MPPRAPLPGVSRVRPLTDVRASTYLRLTVTLTHMTSKALGMRERPKLGEATVGRLR